MSNRPPEHEIVALAEKIIVQKADKVRSVHLFSARIDLAGPEAATKAAFELAEVFLKERNRRATAATAATFDAVIRINHPGHKRRGKKKPARKKGKR